MAKSLKRSLGLLEVTAYGVGLILGAGIYALIGQSAVLAGNGIWLSFIIAATIAALTALSYAELASSFSENSSEHYYISKAFNSKFLAFMTGWLIVVMGLLSAATIAVGFGQYAEVITGVSGPVIAIILILVLSLVNFWGIEESARFNVVSTVVEVLALIVVIFLGLPHIGNVQFMADLNVNGILQATALIFFAYVGFEGIVKLGEETKKPHQVLPQALILSLIITTVIYIALSATILGAIPLDQLQNDPAPLLTLVEEKTGLGWVMGLVAWLAISNGVLIMLVVTSRIMYGMARHRALPAFLGEVHEQRQTPHYAVLVTGVISAALVLLGGIDFLANAANFATFLVFALVNACVIKLRFSSNWNPAYESPVRLGKIPVLAVLGFLSSLAIMLILPIDVWLTGIAFIALGILVYFLSRRLTFKSSLWH